MLKASLDDETHVALLYIVPLHFHARYQGYLGRLCHWHRSKNKRPKTIPESVISEQDNQLGRLITSQGSSRTFGLNRVLAMLVVNASTTVQMKLAALLILTANQFGGP